MRRRRFLRVADEAGSNKKQKATESTFLKQRMVSLAHSRRAETPGILAAFPKDCLRSCNLRPICGATITFPGDFDGARHR
jgi:hypothetical protein